MTDIFIGEPVDTCCTSNIGCDLDNYVYAICRCALPCNYALKIPKIKGKHVYKFKCTKCGTEGIVYT